MINRKKELTQRAELSSRFCGIVIIEQETDKTSKLYGAGGAIAAGFTIYEAMDHKPLYAALAGCLAVGASLLSVSQMLDKRSLVNSRDLIVLAEDQLMTAVLVHGLEPLPTNRPGLINSSEIQS